jgi:paraquat-inducible protein B
VGAPVDFRGISIGEVSAISAHFDPATKEFTIPVEVSIFPERLISKDNWQRNSGNDSSQRLQFASYLVSKGLRAQLRTGSLLTGQLYVAMDFFPSAPKVTMDWRSDRPQLPTVPGNLQSLQDALAGLVSKLNAIPFDGISKDLRKTLGDADVLLNTMNHDVAPDTRATLAAARETLASANRALQSDSPLQQSTTDTMRELSRAAESVRSLADYLERHPESLIRGKPGDRP